MRGLKKLNFKFPCFKTIITFVLILVSFAPHADGALFTAQGLFDDGSALSGTVDIDTVAGVFTAINLVVGPPNRVFSDNIQQSVESPPFYYSVFVQNTAATEDLGFGLELSSLVGYQGGPICSLFTLNCVPSGLVDLSTGDFGATLSHGTFSPVPEPAAAALVGSALAGLWVLGRHMAAARR